jgi:MFS family permease
MDMKPPKWILIVIVVAQFCCTSLWFAGNGVMNDLVSEFGLRITALGHLTSAVQFGFITGTLVFAIFTIADRFSPSKVFLISAFLGAIFNIGVIWDGHVLLSLLLLRFLTGFFLAGIYPIGMKIAADYYNKGLEKSLGFLVGALVLGTAFPHLLNGISQSFPWKAIIVITSGLAGFGGLIMVLLVSDGPNRTPSTKFDFSAFFRVFRNFEFRSAAFGYFGHMWELYAFWAFVPVILTSYLELHPGVEYSISILSFSIIAIGGIACVLGGYLSQIVGTKKTAGLALLFSCICCLLSPFAFGMDSAILFMSFLLFWGMAVVADSPLFSTLVAQNAPGEIKGTALTIVNCIGFSITIISIQIINSLRFLVPSNAIYVLLAIGPVLGLFALRSRVK